ncbi:10261_t:CDS:2 [Ambispora gerdemannii]|uniref:10261_t:CDS:1 n=1 Tax=Ambispora gerdemannii TaxID=144530 RepID=A0A9N9FFJ2_9GLOM|nr:10261_t:CDS:2 [Ambispora gerdemannii]
MFVISISSVQSFYSSDEISGAETGILIDNKVIIFDSYDFRNATTAFSLDLSKNWTTFTPGFTAIDNLVSAPTFYFTAFSAQKKDNHSVIYAFGGRIPINGNFSNFNYTNKFYKIDVNPSSFSFSPLDSPLQARSSVQSVIDDQGKLYIWGGYTYISEDKAMYIFDTFDSTWNQILPSGYVPDQRKLYTSTFKDGKIYYIGGAYRTSEVADIRQILIYDTLKNASPWSSMMATNKTEISNRIFHSAVLAPDNISIIIFGGMKEFYNSRNSSLDYTLYDYLITLNLEQFEFSELKTLNKLSIDDIPARHAAIIYNNFMIVAFGIYETTNPTRKLVKLLDLSQKEYNWVDKYIAPTPTPSPPPSSPSPPRLTTPTSPTPPIKIIVISTIGSLVFVVAIVIGFIFFYRKKHRNEQTAINSNILQTRPNTVLFPNIPVIVDQQNTNPNTPEIICQQTTTQVPFGYPYAHNDPRTSYGHSLAFKPSSQFP